MTNLILGLGKTGKSLVNFFLHRGEEKIFVFDDNQQNISVEHDDVIQHIDPETLDWKQVSQVFVSPGVPIKYPVCHKVVEFAEKNGCKLTNDVQFFLELMKEKLNIGVTGTNGKSTTTSMIAHILGSGFTAVGNIGKPVMECLDGYTGYVVEFSSYQLEVCNSLSLSTAVLLDTTPDHIDRYPSFDDYVYTKSRIFNNPETTAVIALNSDANKKLFSTLENHRKIGISVSEVLHQGFSMIGRKIYENGKALITIPSSVVQFNENVLAAFVCTRLHGISEDEFLKKITSFTALSHRCEQCGSYRNITFVNDSKATNIASLQGALSLYGDRNIYLLAGGRMKNKDDLKDSDSLKCVKRAYFFGEAAGPFTEAQSPYIMCRAFSRLEEAFFSSVEEALTLNEEVVILLSPGCSSFDAFKNFEERGECFKSLVTSLNNARVMT